MKKIIRLISNERGYTFFEILSSFACWVLIIRFVIIPLLKWLYK